MIITIIIIIIIRRKRKRRRRRRRRKRRRRRRRMLIIIIINSAEFYCELCKIVCLCVCVFCVCFQVINKWRNFCLICIILILRRSIHFRKSPIDGKPKSRRSRFLPIIIIMDVRRLRGMGGVGGS